MYSKHKLHIEFHPLTEARDGNPHVPSVVGYTSLSGDGKLSAALP